eukprot:Ihof_evm1s498 gene=Ihof_evmTU1s498
MHYKDYKWTATLLRQTRNDWLSLCQGAFATHCKRLVLLVAIILVLVEAVEVFKCKCMTLVQYQVLITCPFLVLLGSFSLYKACKVTGSGASQGGTMDHLIDPARPMPILGLVSSLLVACHVMFVKWLMSRRGLLVSPPGTFVKTFALTGLAIAVVLLWVLIVLQYSAVFTLPNPMSTSSKAMCIRWGRWVFITPLALIGVSILLIILSKPMSLLAMIGLCVLPVITLQWAFGFIVLFQEWRLIVGCLLPAMLYLISIHYVPLRFGWWSFHEPMSILLISGYALEAIVLWVLVAMETVQGLVLTVRAWEYYVLLPATCG